MNIKQLISSLKPNKAQKELAMAFVPSAATFGLAGFLGLIYYTDWRLVTNFIPIYNTKYPKPETK